MTTASEQRTPEPGGEDPLVLLRERLGFALPAATPAGRARQAALLRAGAAELTPAPAVVYHSAGTLLILGPQPSAVQAARRLGLQLRCSVLAQWSPDETPARPADDPAAAEDPAAEGFPIINAPLVELSGHLGKFQALVEVDGEPRPLASLAGLEAGCFDLVLDLGRTPVLRQELPPPGYYAPCGDAEALERALAELPEMVGEFEKPRYFVYTPDLCAHGGSGLTGCTRCLDSCPTLAITSIGEKIEVDPHLCQGAGACSAVCPTGAIGYGAPPSEELRETVRVALDAFRRDAPGESPCLLLHDAAGGRRQIAALAEKLPEWVIPWELEEIGSTGIELWLMAIAHGARGVCIRVDEATPPSVIAVVRDLQRLAQTMLEAMGYRGAGLQLIEGASDEELLRRLEEQRAADWEPATFAAVGESRNVLRLALDHLYAQAPSPAAETALPAGAPFGTVKLDTGACTLCMACAGICPTGALMAGNELPALRLLEWNCIQCGLCEKSCPENAVALQARLILDPERRRQERTLHEDQPFHCVVCGTPFATQSVLARMEQKLAGHRMFQGAEERRRLQMCADCRVKDMFVRDGGLGGARQ